MAYTIEEKQEFLGHVETMKEAMLAILEMRGSGAIINEVGLEQYPFNESFDELQARMGNWIDAIQEGIESHATKGA